MRSLFFRLFRADLAHLWNNRRKFDADAVWAMSERELLLAVWLAWLTRRRSRPVLVGEVIWLIDDWPCFDPVRRWLWRVTLSAADCLLVATEGSARKLCDILPNANIRAYRFGIPLNVYTSLRDRPGLLEGAGRKRPVRVLAAGNDLRRDWETVAKALGGDERFDVTLLSRRTAVRDMAKFGANVHYQQADRLSGLLERYRWADMVVIASLPNSHGAGMTMLLEAAAAGIPIICASTGFIDEFFDEDSVTYVPPCDPAALKRAAAALAADPAEAAAKAKRARRAITRLGYGSMDAVDRRCAIIRQCLWNSSLAAIDRPTASSSTPAEPKATPR
ncbi:MAG: glycosyltransferase [Geminicoccaceae bacterium]